MRIGKASETLSARSATSFKVTKTAVRLDRELLSIGVSYGCQPAAGDIGTWRLAWWSRFARMLNATLRLSLLTAISSSADEGDHAEDRQAEHEPGSERLFTSRAAMTDVDVLAADEVSASC